jgi:predicted RNA binding protein YcfA (HicA-like mRNA interferase family)
MEPFATVIVPENKELPLGTLRSIIRNAGLTVDEFIELL